MSEEVIIENKIIQNSFSKLTIASEEIDNLSNNVSMKDDYTDPEEWISNKNSLKENLNNNVQIEEMENNDKTVNKENQETKSIKINTACDVFDIINDFKGLKLINNEKICLDVIESKRSFITAANNSKSILDDDKLKSDNIIATDTNLEENHFEIERNAKGKKVETESNKNEKNTETDKEKIEGVEEKTERVDKKTESVKENTKGVKEKTESVEEKTESVEEKTESVKEKTESVEEKAESVKVKAEGVKKKAEGDKEKAEGVEEKAEGVEEKAEGVEEKTESVEEKTESVEEKTESVEEKTESVEEKTESVEEKAESVKEKAEGVEEKAEGVKEKAEGVEEKAEGVKEKAEGVKEKAEGVEEKAEGVKEKTEGVKEKAEGVEEKAEGVEEKAEGVEEKAEGVEEKAEGVKEKAEGVNEKAHLNLQNIINSDVGSNQEIKPKKNNQLCNEDSSSDISHNSALESNSKFEDYLLNIVKERKSEDAVSYCGRGIINHNKPVQIADQVMHFDSSFKQPGINSAGFIDYFSFNNEDENSQFPAFQDYRDMGNQEMAPNNNFRPFQDGPIPWNQDQMNHGYTDTGMYQPPTPPKSVSPPQQDLGSDDSEVLRVINAIDKASCSQECMIPALEAQKIRNILEGSEDTMRNEMGIYLPKNDAVMEDDFDRSQVYINKHSTNLLENFPCDDDYFFGNGLPLTPPKSVSPFQSGYDSSPICDRTNDFVNNMESNGANYSDEILINAFVSDLNDLKSIPPAELDIYMGNDFNQPRDLSNARQVIQDKCTPNNLDHVFRLLSALGPKVICQKDDDGDTPVMITFCASDSQPNYFENIYCLQEQVQNIKVCCEIPLGKAKKCKLCHNSDPSKFYSPLSIKNNLGDTVLHCVVKTEKSPEIINFLLHGIAQNKEDVRRVFSDNSKHFFTNNSFNYPSLYEFI